MSIISKAGDWLLSPIVRRVREELKQHLAEQSVQIPDYFKKLGDMLPKSAVNWGNICASCKAQVALEVKVCPFCGQSILTE